MAKSATTYATGKRKTAVAKVWVKSGKGEIIVNGMDLNTWLGGHEAIKLKVIQPLLATKQEKSMNITAQTLGGGYNAQAEALRHGISKALAAMDSSFRAMLKPQGLLTRDSRSVERKKYGKREKPTAAHNFLNANFWLFAPCHCEQILKIQICLTRGNATLAMTLFYLCFGFLCHFYQQHLPKKPIILH